MARRATVFSNHNDPVDTLRIAGPYEFNKWDGSSRLTTGHEASLFKGYEALDYSLGILPRDETQAASFFHKNGPPGAWLSLSSHPAIHRITTSNGNIAAVVFPAMPDNKPLSGVMMQDLLSTIKKERNRTDTKLIIGISPWGRQQEQKFLDTYSGVCDVLLGSGPGPGLISSMTPNKKTLWVRAYSKGRTVSMIEIEHFPARGALSAWRMGQDIHSRLLVLNEKVQENHAMQKTLAPLDAKAKTSQTRRRTSCGK